MEDKQQQIRWGVFVTILLGVFMGALDSSLISPARKGIEQELAIDSSVGVWMITIYTLIYAVSMPITGKLSDIFGRARVFKWSTLLFGLGALVSGLSDVSSLGLPLLLTGRAIQALGGGGIMPVANAEMGLLFPPEKRGTALGMIGAVFGVASILGPTIGSSILDVFGMSNWGWLFFLQVPLAIVPWIPHMGLASVPPERDRSKPLDILGTILITVSLLAFMYGLTNFQLSHPSTFFGLDVWPFVVASLVLMPIFAIVEKRSLDPVINMNFFSNRNIVLALVISTFTGICLMGMIFVPQWAENLLRIPTGKGGYIVTAMSVFSGVAAPMGGSLLDKYGAKRIIMMGFAFTLGGCLLMAWWVQCLWQVFIALAFVGLGIGFTMGAPLNYLILTLVSTDESGAALAVLSLFRSIGTTLGPSLMAGYLVDAGKNLMSEMKDSIPAFKMMPQATGTAAPKGIDILQTADITNIVDKLAQFLKGLDDIPSMVKPIILAQVKGNSSAIQDVYQKVMSGGFNNIYITTGVMALIGLLLTAVMTSSARAEKHVNSSSN